MMTDGQENIEGNILLEGEVKVYRLREAEHGRRNAGSLRGVLSGSQKLKFSQTRPNKDSKEDAEIGRKTRLHLKVQHWPWGWESIHQSLFDLYS